MRTCLLLGLRTISVRPGAASIDLPVVEVDEGIEGIEGFGREDATRERETTDASEKRPSS